jgi:hypothetical protein
MDLARSKQECEGQDTEVRDGQRDSGPGIVGETWGNQEL